MPPEAAGGNYIIPKMRTEKGKLAFIVDLSGAKLWNEEYLIQSKGPSQLNLFEKSTKKHNSE